MMKLFAWLVFILVFAMGLALMFTAPGMSARRIGGGQVASAFPACNPLPTITYGAPFKYNSGYASGKYVDGDIWFNTWDDLGRNVAANNDTHQWQQAGPSANFAIQQLSNTLTTTTGTNINTMQPWGPWATAGSDGFSFKAGGIISVHGTLYVAANRATNSAPGAPHYQYMLQNMQLIKSTDHGAIFTPLPPAGTAAPYNNTQTPPPTTTPTFSGYKMGNADFLQYGKDYAGVGSTAGAKPDNADTYVYAYSTEGPYNNANSVYLSRVLISAIGNQSASDWTFYQGGNGTLDGNQPASWSSTWPPATAVITGSFDLGASVGTQYFPTLGCYVRINWWYPSAKAGTALDTTQSTWQGWAAPQPWGPWAMIGAAKQWNAVNPTPGVGLFSPHIMPASLAPSGNTVNAMALSAGDYNSQNAQTGDYTMTMVPVTLTQ
jgi:hypothetical protein